MNNFRSSLSGRPIPHEEGPVMPVKKPSGAIADNLGSLQVTREVRRSSNQRDDDRHRLSDERARLIVGRKTHGVELVNLSGGGAMVSTDAHLDMFQKVSLILGDCDGLDCAVLWIRDDRVGLEFAPETQIGAKRPERDRILLDVLQRNFPDVRTAPATPEPVRAPEPADSEDHRRVQQRHPLIWTGSIHFDHDTTPVRLRNISATGALVECSAAFPSEAEILLDLGGAGQHFARICWSRGDQVGLKFSSPFDLGQLAGAKPSLANSKWVAPDYLRVSHNSQSAWSNMSLDELEGYLKR